MATRGLTGRFHGDEAASDRRTGPAFILIQGQCWSLSRAQGHVSRSQGLQLVVSGYTETRVQWGPMAVRHQTSIPSKGTDGLQPVPLYTEAAMRNDRQAVFQLTREIVDAQFIKGDEELSRRLWDDVAARGIDPGRVINLMYRCWFHGDDGAMLEADHAYQSLDR